jgi:hypothetical protein
MPSRSLASAATACFVILGAAPAYAADSCVNTAGSGGCFASISGAVADAGTGDGDTITVAAGEYNENQVLVNKGVEIVGAGRGKTIIDGNGAAIANAGTVRMSGTADQALRNLTVRDPGLTGGSRYGVTIKTLAPAQVTLDNIEILGANRSDYGLYADNVSADIDLGNSHIAGTANNPVLMERVTGAVDIHDNVVEDVPFAIFFMSYSGSDVTAPQRVRDNRIVSSGGAVSFNGGFFVASNGKYDDVAITGNDITSGGSSAIGLNNSSTDPAGANGVIDGAVVRDNSIRAAGPAVVANSRGVNITGRVTDSLVEGNTIRGFATGVRSVNAGAGHGPSGTGVHFNRIVANTTPASNDTGASVNAENNWWGCNAGPGSPGCGTLTGTGTIDSDPWLVLRAAAAPASIQTGGQTSTITADLTRNSAGAEPAGNLFPDDTPVAFTTDLGTLSPANDLTTAASAQTTLTSGATAGTANVSATLDGQPVAAPVQITAPPQTTTPDPGTGGGGTQQTPPAATPNQPSTPAAGVLSLRNVRTVKVDRLGRFMLVADAGPGVLVARGTSKTSRIGTKRLVGQRQRVSAGVVRMRLRLSRATRMQLLDGRKVSARVNVTLTPPDGGAPATQAISVRVTR